MKLKNKIKLCRGPNRAGLAEVFVPDNVWKHSWKSRELVKPEGRTPLLCIHSESSALPFSCSWLVAFDLLESHPKPKRRVVWRGSNDANGRKLDFFFLCVFPACFTSWLD